MFFFSHKETKEGTLTPPPPDTTFVALPDLSAQLIRSVFSASRCMSPLIRISNPSYKYGHDLSLSKERGSHASRELDSPGRRTELVPKQQTHPRNT